MRAASSATTPPLSPSTPKRQIMCWSPNGRHTSISHLCGGWTPGNENAWTNCMFQHVDFSTVSPGRYVWQCTLAMALQIFSNPLKSLQPSGHSFFQVTGHTIVSQSYQAAAILWLASWHSRGDLYCLCPWSFHEETQEAKITFLTLNMVLPFCGQLQD